MDAKLSPQTAGSVDLVRNPGGILRPGNVRPIQITLHAQNDIAGKVEVVANLAANKPTRQGEVAGRGGDIIVIRIAGAVADVAASIGSIQATGGGNHRRRLRRGSQSAAISECFICPPNRSSSSRKFRRPPTHFSSHCSLPNASGWNLTLGALV